MGAPLGPRSAQAVDKAGITEIGQYLFRLPAFKMVGRAVEAG